MSDMMPDGDKRHGSGRRTADQDRAHKPRHWLAVQASRHPIGVALVVAIGIAMIPLVMVLDQQSTIKAQAAKIESQAAQLSDLVQRMNTDRALISDTFCHKLNANAKTNNNQTTALESIIVGSTTASRPFEHVYRQFGLPPYKERLRQARRLAGRLNRNRVDITDCKVYVKQIERITEHLPAPSHIPPNKK